ncbi:MAG: protein kinase [Phycisphaerae bacterium]
MAKRLENLMFVRELGVGAGTRVALMRDVKDGKQYCRKSVGASAENFNSQVRQLKNEFDIGVQNSHPILRKSFEYGILKRKLRAVEAYNILAYVDGVALDKYAEDAPLSLTLKIFWHVADGLLDLHRRGFIHADLKPQNILCAKNGRPTIIDFGQGCAMLHRKHRIQGTENFIAPEQVDRKALDQRTDVFGLGATMHKILLGRPIETRLNTTSVRKGGRVTLEQMWKGRNERAAELDTALLKLIEDCIQQDRAARPDSMQLVKDRIEVTFDRMSKAG